VRRSETASLIICILFPLACSGCITASLVTLGTAFSALGSAASTGVDVYKLGKLDSALMTTADECHRAVLLATIDLGLAVHNDQRTDKMFVVYEMALLDTQKSQVGIHIEQRTQSMCLCRVDVGFFGSEPTAKLMMERIRVHLHLMPATAPADGSI
jgi:Protein of unknown function (DUF3568)